MGDGTRKSTDGHVGAGDRFQRETKYTPETIGGHFLDLSRRPRSFKDYKDSIARIALPEPKFAGESDLWQILYKRRSRRSYEGMKTVDLDVLSALLWATQGVTARYADTLFRTAPSAGGLYPAETYVSARMVENLEPGIYHFRPHIFDLEFLKQGDCSRELAEAALGQGIVMGAQLTFIWSAVVERSKWKYRQRAYRYIYMDVGHIAQNLYLAGETLGLGVCAIGAFYDDQVNRLIGVDGVEEMAIYMATVGWPKGSRDN